MRKLKSLCAPYYSTLAEAAMRYVLSARQVSTLIPGMKNRAEVDMNVLYSDGRAFPAELAAQLPAHNWPRNFYK
jgi:predicted aldo/keto reductase-like oxidoreductase